ncbi:MAG: RDD family protein [Acidimicrobiales bacterium]
MAEGRRTPVVGGLIGRVVPEVLRNVDTDELLDTLDVDAIVERLDIDAVAARLDLDALMMRLDMDALVDQLDVNKVAAQLDLDALMMRLDMDALVDQLDVNKVAAQLDLDALMMRLDMDALVDRLDVNKVADQLDLDALMEKIEISRIMGRGTQEIAEGSLDFVRRQLVRFDAAINGIVWGLLRRERADFAEGPPELVQPTEEAEVDPSRPVDRRQVSGHYAGVVTRAAALWLDVVGALTGFGLVGAMFTFLLATIFEVDVVLSSTGWLNRVLLVSWMLAWFWLPVAIAGRTAGMLLVGLRIVRRSGRPVRAGRSLVRALMLPVSLVLFLVAFLGVFLGRERRALHDVVADTVVVYDWGRRPAEQPSSLIARAGQLISDNRAPAAEPT